MTNSIQSFKNEYRELSALIADVNNSIARLSSRRSSALYVAKEKRLINEAILDLSNVRAKLDYLRENIGVVLKKN